MTTFNIAGSGPTQYTIRQGENTELATQRATEAAASASAAATSASIAEAASGPSYADTTAGLAATSSGESFAVLNGDDSVTVYLNDSGVAVEQREIATTAYFDASIYYPDPANSPTSLRVGDVGLTSMASGGVGHNVVVGIRNVPEMTGAGVSPNPNLGYGMSIFGTSIGRTTMVNPKDCVLIGYENGYHLGDAQNLISIGAKNFYGEAGLASGTAAAETRSPSSGVAIGLTIGFAGMTFSTVEFVAIGNNVGYSASRFYRTCIIGHAAAQYTSGQLLTSCAVGVRSLGGNVDNGGTYSENNCAFGNLSLGSLKDGSDNCAFGTDSLLLVQDGGNNCAFGGSSLASVVNSGQNAAFGHASATAYVGTQTAAFGYEAFKAAVGSAGTTLGHAGVGYRVGFQATGSYVSGLGWNALPNLTSGTRIVAVGAQAGTTQATGNRNVYIGDFTTGTAAGDDQVAIGDSATCTASNQFMFGNAANTFQYVFNGYSQSKVYTVAALPAATTAGRRAFVSDSTVAASGNFGATVAGGGSNNVPVFSDGTNWLIG